MALGPGPLEDLQQQVGRLGARGAVLPVDDEERDARGAEELGGRGVLGGRGPVTALGERGARIVGVQPDLGRERDEGVDVEDRAGLGEVGVQQPLLELALAAVLGGEVQQLVREGRVAADALGEVVLEALLSGHLLDPGHVRPHLLDGRAVLRGQGRERLVGLALRDARVELEGPPDDLDLVAVGEPLECGLQPALADVAPRTDDVGPDLYLHAWSNFVALSSIPGRHRTPTRSTTKTSVAPGLMTPPAPRSP